MTAATVKRPPIYVTVPSDIKGRQCRGCPAWIYDVPSAKNPKTTMPIHCDVEGGHRPVFGAPLFGEEAKPGRGVNHFSDCPAAAVPEAAPMTVLIPLIVAIVLAWALISLIGTIPRLAPERKLQLHALVILLFIGWVLYRYGCYLAAHGCNR
jgi:hypothetical protein